MEKVEKAYGSDYDLKDTHHALLEVDKLLEQGDVTVATDILENAQRTVAILRAHAAQGKDVRKLVSEQMEDYFIGALEMLEKSLGATKREISLVNNLKDRSF